MRLFILAAATVIVPYGLAAQGQPPVGGRGNAAALPRWMPDPASQLFSAPLPATVNDGFRLVTLGDLLYWRPVRLQADSGMEVALRLVRDADFAMANHEGTYFDLRTKRIPPTGRLMVGPPELGDDIEYLGIDLVSKANNHSIDWGLQGLVEQMRLMNASGLAYAGAGENRAAARAPAFVDTPKGRVAVVAAASSFQPGAIPMDEEGDFPARPGISILRTTSVQTVTAQEMAVLQRMEALRAASGVRLGGRGGRVTRGGGAGAEGRGARADSGGLPRQITVLGQSYRLGDRSGVTYTMNNWDHFEILREIHSAKRLADLVVFTIHAHEGQDGTAGGGDSPFPADFLTVLFHNAIDAGADVVAGHGSHALRGIEIYKGRPIFYGLSTFIFQGFIIAGMTQEGREAQDIDPRYASRGETYTRRDAVEWRGPGESTGLLGSWDVGVIPVITYKNGLVEEIRVYPLDLRRSYDWSLRTTQSGLPRLAAPALARRTLELLRDLSAQFGTEVRIEGSVGVIRPLAGGD